MAERYSFNCEKPMNENHFEAVLNRRIHPMAATASAIATELPAVTTEFLNALASVHSLSEILRDHPGIDRSQKQHFISIILAETKRMTDMVGCLPTGAGLMRLEYAC
jgi:hypothetical protein